ncbi:hypothetical protein IM511_07590 [Erythrobacteraceae bacterium E2-1 Yellow Sea]|nr:hypothetical protein [Erythrobacteraceae bacterium E2-1 Yellow Sea]
MADWYRNTDWNDEIEEQFFVKLARARSQRDQYIVLQALTLAESHPQVTLRLVDYYFGTRTDDFDDGRARMAASRANFALGGYEKALDDYLEGMADNGENQAIYVASPIQFAFMAARYRSQRHYLPALDALNGLEPPDGQGELPFIYFAAYAMLLDETGKDPNGAQVLAEKALSQPQQWLDHFGELTWRLRGITRS